MTVKNRKPTLLISPKFPFVDGSGNPITDLEKLTDELDTYVQRYKLLTDSGYDIKYLQGDTSRLGREYYPIRDSLIKELGKDAVLVIDVKPEEQDELYIDVMMWPQNSFQILGNKVFVRPQEHTNAYGILSRSSFPDVEKVTSCFGDGGYIVKLGKVLLFSSAAPLATPHSFDPHELNVISYLKKHYSVYPVTMNFSKKDINDQDTNILIDRLSKNNHIDTEINLIKDINGKHHIIASHEYSSVFAKELRGLADYISASIFRVPQRERLAINFISMPDGKAIIPEGYRVLQKFLDAKLGKENVIPLNMVNREMDEEGGLKCRSNIIY